MDLSSIQPVAIEVAIRHPGTGAPTGLVMRVVSPQDPAAGAARRTYQDRVSRSKNGIVAESDTIEFVAALVQGWEWGGDASWNGEKLPFTLANVRTVVSESWLRAQIDEAIGDSSAFFRK